MRMRLARKAILPDRRARAERDLARYLLELPSLREARIIGIYHAVGSELGLAPTIHALRALVQEPTIAYPLVVSEEAMVFRRFGQGEDLSCLDNPKQLHRDIEPARVIEPTDIDALLVPGIAFDLQGNRLGQGGGYYDRYLPHLRADAIAIGIAFNEQIVEEVPHDPHDCRVDYVATPSRLISTC